MQSKTEKIHTTLHYISLILCCMMVAYNVQSQGIQITQSNVPPYTASNVINNVFLGEGVEITNINFEGVNGAVGVFSNGAADVGLERGLLLSTGNVTNVGGDGGTSASQYEDADLESIVNGESLFDIVKYEITFRPISDTLRFNYAFASDEYPDYVCSDFNDVFGFFISGPNPAGGMYQSENIALVPDPNDPSIFTDFPVAINSVNSGEPGFDPDIGNIGDCDGMGESLDFDTYFNDNRGNSNLELNGILDVFVAQAIVEPCEEYTIKLVLADVGDETEDSAVFLEAKSFGTNAIKIDRITNSVDGTLGEGCAAGLVRVRLPYASEGNTVIPYTILDSAPGVTMATKDVDYVINESNITISDGASQTFIEVTAAEDNVEEGREAIFLEIQRDVCNLDTIKLYIEDDRLAPAVSLPQDTMLCGTSQLTIQPIYADDFNPIQNPVFRNEDGVQDIEDNTPAESCINISGVEPAILNEQSIVRVCIGSILHSSLSDLNIYLKSPSEKFLELSTKNGINTAMAMSNAMLQTCFTIDATQPINRGVSSGSEVIPNNPSYTGDFLPEGNFADLWSSGNDPVNGKWTLIVVDDQNGFEGSLVSWSIELESPYDINFDWAPVNGLSCGGCEAPVASPTETTTYTVEMIDSYGCSASGDEITITPGDPLEAPMITSCDALGSVNVTIEWTEVQGAESYEIQFEGESDWLNVGPDLAYDTLGLQGGTDFVVNVRARNSECAGDVATCTFMTASCAAPTFDFDIIEPTTSCSSDGQIILSNIDQYPVEWLINGEFTGSSTFANLEGGSYRLNVRNTDTGCTSADIFVTLEQPRGMIVSYFPPDQIQLSCAGDTDGSFLVNVDAGVAPYTFMLNGSAFVPPFENNAFQFQELGAGSYELVVSDSQGCSADPIYVVITEPQELRILDVEEFGETCSMSGDGRTVTTVIGGTQPYTFLWDDANQTTDQNLSNVSAGIYNVTVTDAKGCTDEVNSIIIPGAAEIESDIASQDASCSQIMDGFAQVTASAGMRPYRYVWTNGETTERIENLGVGTYTVTISDGRGCIQVDSIIIEAQQDVEINFDIVEVNCRGENTGVINLTTENTSGNETYTWGDTPDNVAMRDELLPGDYFVTVTDTNGCSSEEEITLIDPGGPNISVAVLDSVKCFGESSGNIYTAITGGKPSFEFIWTRINEDDSRDTVSTESTLLGFPTGIYNFEVTDRDNCKHEKTFELGEPDSLDLSSTMIFSNNCNGDSLGIISSVIEGGTGPFRYRWAGPDEFVSMEESLTDLVSGTYRLNVRDENNCAASMDFLVDEPSTKIQINPIEPDTICFNTSSGVLETIAFGGTGDLDYEWNTGSANPRIIELESGDYSLTVTDGNGCTDSIMAQVIELDTIELDLGAIDATCSYINDAQAFVEFVGFGSDARAKKDFTFEWNTSNIEVDSIVTDLVPGTAYTVLATDDRFGCKGSATITASAPEPLIISGEVTDVVCNGENTGSIIVSATGGNGGEVFIWDSSTGFQETDMLTNIEDGIYSVTVTDDKGCTETEVYTVSEISQISVTSQGLPITCNGDSDGRGQVFISGGTGVYDLLWDTGDETLVIDSLQPGDYSYVINDSNECEVTGMITVDDVSELDLTIVEVIPSSCSDTYDGRIILEGSGGNGSYSYNVNGGEYIGSPEIIGLGPGLYDIGIKDAKGCVTDFAGIELPEKGPFEVFLPEDTIVVKGASVTTAADFIEGDSIFYEWIASSGMEVQCDSCATSTLESVDEDLILTLIASDADGCFKTLNRRIFVDEDGYLFVPTGFTPDGNSVNDILSVYGREGVFINTFRVYSEWGQLVYEQNNFEINDESIGWDGNFNGEAMNQDTYIWTVDATYPDGTTQQFAGNTTLIR